MFKSFANAGFLAFLATASLVQAAPLTERATGQISCLPVGQVVMGAAGPGTLSLVAQIAGFSSPNNAIGQTTSAGGLQKLVKLQGDAQPLKVVLQQCNSTYLDFTYSEQYQPGQSPVKIVLDSDHSKCIQRHGALSSSNPGARTHISIEPCSNVDDGTQARQFWDLYLPYQTLSPIVRRNGKIMDLPLDLSGGSPDDILAGQGYNKYAFNLKSST